MSDEGLIFISCGQSTPEEKTLGQNVSALIEELTPYTPYFAEDQSSLDALTRHILGALDKAVALIAIMHPRGVVKLLGGKEEVRASVWIEQEIAMAAYITQVLERPLKVSVYIHSEIRLEGMRQQLLLNPTSFENDTEVLQHLRSVLPDWKDLPLPPLLGRSDGAIDQESIDIVSIEMAKLEKPYQEALRLLSQYGSMTDMFVLEKLRDQGLRADYEIFPRLKRKTGFVSPVPGQVAPKRPEYDLAWEINPKFRAALHRYFKEHQAQNEDDSRTGEAHEL